MDCPADLFIEQDILGKFGNPVIEPDSKFTDITGPRIDIQSLLQKSLILPRRSLDHPSPGELQVDLIHFFTVIDSREIVGYIALRRILHRSIEYFPVGHISMAVAFNALPAGDAKAQIGARSDNAHLGTGIESFFDPILKKGLFLPIDVGSPIEKILIFE